MIIINIIYTPKFGEVLEYFGDHQVVNFNGWF